VYPGVSPGNCQNTCYSANALLQIEAESSRREASV